MRLTPYQGPQGRGASIDNLNDGDFDDDGPLSPPRRTRDAGRLRPPALRVRALRLRLLDAGPDLRLWLRRQGRRRLPLPGGLSRLRPGACAGPSEAAARGRSATARREFVARGVAAPAGLPPLETSRACTARRCRRWRDFRALHRLRGAPWAAPRAAAMGRRVNGDARGLLGGRCRAGGRALSVVGQRSNGRPPRQGGGLGSSVRCELRPCVRPSPGQRRRSALIAPLGALVCGCAGAQRRRSAIASSIAPSPPGPFAPP